MAIVLLSIGAILKPKYIAEIFPRGNFKYPLSEIIQVSFFNNSYLIKKLSIIVL